MQRQILIRKMALSASIVLTASIIILVLQFPYRHWQHKKHLKILSRHENQLIEHFQNYLDETAGKINSRPVNAKIISDIQSYILLQNDNPKLFLWMNDTNGNFVMGVPSIAFDQLNHIFNKYQHLIEKDDRYFSRNDFMIKAINKYSKLNFSNSDADPVLDLLKPGPHWYDEKPYEYLFTKPVTNTSGQIIGELYLKIDDEKNSSIYRSRFSHEMNDLYSVLNPVIGFFIFISAVLLWLLLPSWVYIDARERDVKYPILWVVITVVSTVWGFAIYLIIRPTKTKTLLCPECKNELNGIKAFCPHCGLDLSNILCPECQYPLKPEWAFCPSCRAEIKQKARVKTKKSGKT